jgi:hypothetical protein
MPLSEIPFLASQQPRACMLQTRFNNLLKPVLCTKALGSLTSHCHPFKMLGHVGMTYWKATSFEMAAKQVLRWSCFQYVWWFLYPSIQGLYLTIKGFTAYLSFCLLSHLYKHVANSNATNEGPSLAIVEHPQAVSAFPYHKEVAMRDEGNGCTILEANLPSWEDT